MKRVLSVFLSVLLLASLCFSLLSCGETASCNQHVFGEYLKDATEHWRICSNEGCGDIADKAAHTWDSGVVMTPATSESDGVKMFTCTVCGLMKNEAIKLDTETTGTETTGAETVQTRITQEAWNAFILRNNLTLEVTGHQSEGEENTGFMKFNEGVLAYIVKDVSQYLILKDGIWYSYVAVDGDFDYDTFTFGEPNQWNELSPGFDYPLHIGGQIFGMSGEVGETIYNLYGELIYLKDEAAYHYPATDGYDIYLYFENDVLVKVVEYREGELFRTSRISDVGTTTIDIPEFTLGN